MQMVKKILFMVILLWFALLVFMPKIEMYHTLEKALVTEDIKLNEKNIQEGIFSLRVEDITVYIKGIGLVSIASLEWTNYLFYTHLVFNNVSVDESLANKVPTQTDKIEISHTIMRPLIVSVDANGSFGSLVGEAKILEKQVKLDFIETKDISMLKKFLTKSEKGWSYEKSF
jgi:hypothetical protein